MDDDQDPPRQRGWMDSLRERTRIGRKILASFSTPNPDIIWYPWVYWQRKICWEQNRRAVIEKISWVVLHDRRCTFGEPTHKKFWKIPDEYNYIEDPKYILLPSRCKPDISFGKGLARNWQNMCPDDKFKEDGRNLKLGLNNKMIKLT